MENGKVSTRRESREQALLALFQVFLGKNGVEEALQYVTEEGQSSAFLTVLVQGVVSHQAEIDQVIRDCAEKWSLERFGNVELNMIRIATFELIYEQKTPQKVILNEAIEVVRKFSDEKAVKFTNSVLQKISDKVRGV